MPLFERCTKAVERAVEDSKMSHDEVDEIVLVGGSCKIPKIRQDLIEHFGSQVTINDLKDGKEVVARGAAILAGALTDRNQTELAIKDVVPITISVTAEL